MLSEKDFTTILHKNFCIPKTGCWQWYYETEYEGDVWKQPTHKKWLEKAQHILRGSNYTIEDILNALDVVNEVKVLLKKQII